MADAGITKAPWTRKQVAALNRWQTYDFVHPFTCPKYHGDGTRVLVADKRGWRCFNCDYRQDWAHDFMLDQQSSAFGYLKQRER